MDGIQGGIYTEDWKQNSTDKAYDIRRLSIVKDGKSEVEVIDNGNTQTVTITDYYNTIELSRKEFDKIIDRYRKATA